MDTAARRIPFIDLAAEHALVADDVAERWARVVASSTFIAGEEIALFEAAFARFCELEECVAVANGTDALELALRAVGVGPDSEVIIPAATFAATALAVLRIGAAPVLVDVDAASLLDPEEVERALTSRTRAVVAVHLYGQMARCEELLGAVGDHGVALVEDAAQAHGARRHGVGLGTFAAAVSTSFYPSKNLGAYGNAGAVLSNDPEVADRVRVLRNYGAERKYHHPMAGWNSQPDELQAAVLNAKLPGLAERNERRQTAAAYYDGLLLDLPGVARPVVAEGNDHVWHLYVVRVPQRDRVFEALRARGIDVGIHYPVPLHLQGALGPLGHKAGDFPVTEGFADSVLSLPLFPTITPAQQEQVVWALDRCL
jgi:dTDP-4-amino-4,6-dideoxygalactose transaminase